MIDGMKVFVSPDPRRYGDLPADVCVTPAFRAEFNSWSAQFFRPDPSLNPIKDGEAYVVHGNVHVNSRTFAELERHCDLSWPQGGMR